MPHRTGPAPPRIEVVGITRLPEIQRGAALGPMIAVAAREQGTPLTHGDILVVTQKVVSKAEGRTVDLRTVTPSARASELAAETGRDPRLVETILRESRCIVRTDRDRGIIIAETRHGFVCANAGIDASNVPGDETVSLLPEDPDASARRICGDVARASGVEPAVIISDTFGRAWREGQVNFAIGAAGIEPILDYRGAADAQGRVLKVTAIAVADELSSAAEMVMGKADGVPAALVRGYEYRPGASGVASLIRDPAADLFR